MIRRAARRFRDDESGAVSPLYAVAILTLVAMAGIGFDYGRMVALDTELQNAADQAALAAATQLDGSDEAMVNARNAATNAFATATSDYVNETRFSTVGERAITDLSFKFYDGYDSSTDEPGDEVVDDSDGANAKVVEVTVNPRTVQYALTPLVGAIFDNAIGRAMATIEDATCNVPPLMFCTPSRSFPSFGEGGVDDRGKGVPLHMKKNQSGSQSDAENPLWAPGNFGFLDIDYDLHGNPNRTLGVNTTASGCFGDPVESRTGFRTTEAKALNTRFDFYEAPLNSCNSSNGDFCPAKNVRKNWVRVETRKNEKVSDIPGLTCNPNQNSQVEWKAISEIPSTESPPSNPGYPCDTAGCTAFGSGDWGGASWFSTVHPTDSFGSIPDLDGNGSISRYEVYIWELELSSRLAAKKVGYYPNNLTGLPAGSKLDVKLYCSYPQPIDETPFVSSVPQKDRRLLTVAAVDCTGLNGHAAVDILKWVDIFLVTPADKTTGTDEALSGRAFYGEIVGPGEKPNGDSGFQYYSRRKAVLIR
ncbi:MAG TPA: pilus assembly protein TadG-related protein [Novosphingobium sp.]|nr:pilus assembly protein TadG-related protein [Novosphingobium sp.]